MSEQKKAIDQAIKSWTKDHMGGTLDEQAAQELVDTLATLTRHDFESMADGTLFEVHTISTSGDLYRLYKHSENSETDDFNGRFVWTFTDQNGDRYDVSDIYNLFDLNTVNILVKGEK